LSGAQVVCQYLDLYQADQTRQSLVPAPRNLAIFCEADISSQDNDLFALPISSHGEAELVRDLLQAGHESLTVGGQFLTSTDNPHDRWLHAEMQKLFESVTRKPFASGVVYLARKSGPVKKKKSFEAEFQFRHGKGLLKAVTRPGVFSHRHLDPGARHLMNAMHISPGQRVLDIGCGCGAVGFAAAAQGAHVLAVDSNARAVDCTRQGALLNGFNDFIVELSTTGPRAVASGFDLALANPPYYANFRIAQRFMEIAHSALRPGGQILAVTKSPQWYQENMVRWFTEAGVEKVKEYWIVKGRK
jgi:16S rRNA (guanine1207-N2)-methyltransferase